MVSVRLRGLVASFWPGVAALMLMVALGTAPARGDAVPGIGTWEYYHNSTDPSPVTVRFVYQDGTRDLLIPRKYIYFVSDFSSRDGPIPDLIETHSVRLALAYPDGEAWTVAIREYAREHGVGMRRAADEMRDRMHIVEVRPTHNVINLDRVRQRSQIRDLEGFIGEFGLLEFEISRGTQHFFLGSEEDEFLQIICYNPKNPGWLCKHYTSLTPHIVFNADFVDLRIFGGREFANSRMRMIKRTLCTFTESC